MHRPFPPTHPGTGVKDPTLSNSTPPPAGTPAPSQMDFTPRIVSCMLSNDFFPLSAQCFIPIALHVPRGLFFGAFCAVCFPRCVRPLAPIPPPLPSPSCPSAALFGGRRFLETTLAGSGQVPPPPPPYSLGQPSPPLGSVFQRLVPRSAAGPCRLLSSPCGAQPSWAFGPRCFFSRTRPFRHGEGSFSSPRVISTARVHPRPVASVPLIPFAFSPSGALNHRLSSL